MNYFLPLLICSAVTYGVVNIFQPSFFELVIYLRQLHYMPNIINQYKIKSEDKKFNKMILKIDMENSLNLNR